MGLLSYIITLFNNSEIIIKLSLTLILFFFLLTIIILIKTYSEIKKEKNILPIIKKNINCTDILEERIMLKKHKYITHNIYLSGIKEFIKLYKNGINDTHTMLNLIKNKMTIEIFSKNFSINKIKKVKIFIFFFTIIYSVISIILYQKNIFLTYKNLNSLNTLLVLNEIFMPIIISILILVKIKIIENIFANLNFKIYNERKMLIKNFLLILYHKFYD